MERLVNHVSYLLADKLVGDDGNKEIERLKIGFGIETISYNLISIIVVLTLSILFKTFNITLVVFTFFGILRIITGGMHFNSSLQCITATSLITVGGAKASLYITLSNSIVVAIFVLLLILTAKYAPSGTTEHPVSEEDRHIRRFYSIAAVLIYGIICFIVPKPYNGAVLIAASMQIITILPFANKKYKEE